MCLDVCRQLIMDEEEVSRLCHETLQYYPNMFPITSIARFTSAEGSVNNIIRFVCVSDDLRPNYIIRMYKNGNDLDKIKFEHFILNRLDRQHLVFQIPRACISTNGEVIVPLSNGGYASMFLIIPGTLPKLNFTNQVATACAILSNALGLITLTPDEARMICTPPYYEIYQAHPSITRQLFIEQISLPIYESCKDDLSFLAEQILLIEPVVESYRSQDLPKQLIHGDLHYDNILCDHSTREVTGILDFEFCAYDWRAMELAICVSKYISEPDPLPLLSSFISSYCSVSPLSPLECSALPSLIKLRILSNVVFFIGRIMSGQESPSILTGGKASDYRRRVLWVEAAAETIIQIAGNGSKNLGSVTK
jgi:homoserine kinase type II